MFSRTYLFYHLNECVTNMSITTSCIEVDSNTKSIFLDGLMLIRLEVGEVTRVGK